MVRTTQPAKSTFSRGYRIPGNTVEDWEDQADIVPSHVQPHLFRQLSAHDVGQLLFIVLKQKEWMRRSGGAEPEGIHADQDATYLNFDADSDPVCTGT